MRISARFGVSTLVLLLMVAPRAGLSDEPREPDARPGGGSTPALVVERFRAAQEKDDTTEFVACIAPSLRPHLTFWLLYGLAFFEPSIRREDPEGAEKVRAGVQQIFERLDLSEKALRLPHYDMELACADHAVTYLEDVDLARLLKEARALGASAGDPSRFGVDLLGAGALEGVRIHGDWAAGRVGTKPVAFQRVDGRWYLAPGGEPLALYLPDIESRARKPFPLLLDLARIETLARLLAGVPQRPPAPLTARSLSRMGGGGPRIGDRPEAPSAAARVAELLPGKGTFALLASGGSAAAFLRHALEDELDPGELRLLEENLRRMEKGGSLDGLFETLGAHLGTGGGAALARDGHHFDGVTYSEFFADPFDSPDPLGPVLVLALHLAPDASADDVLATLDALVPLLGGGGQLEAKTHRDTPYRRAHLSPDYVDFRTLSPCYAVVGGHLILSSSEPYLRQVIETAGDPRGHPSFAENEAVMSVTRPPDDRSGMTIAFDLQELLRVPSADGEGRGGYLWDCRHAWVVEHESLRDAAVEHRKALVEALQKERGRALNREELEQIEAQVDQFAEAHLSRYPEFEERYRQRLAALGRLRALALSLRASEMHLLVEMQLEVGPRPDDVPEGEGAGAR